MQQKLPLSKEASEVQAPVSLLSQGLGSPGALARPRGGDVALGHVSSGFWEPEPKPLEGPPEGLGTEGPAAKSLDTGFGAGQCPVHTQRRHRPWEGRREAGVGPLLW